MTVNKILIGFTFLLVAAALVGSMMHTNDPFMWFVSSQPAFQAVRGTLLLALLALLFSRPPRSLAFRVMLGLCAMVVAVMTAHGVQTYEVNLIDAVLFIEVAIIFGIEALEIESLSTQTERAKRFAKTSL